MNFLRVDSLSRRYGSVKALADISLSVPAGSRMAIVGPSGSGKTTLLRLIAGFEAPDTGTITLGGQTLADECTFVPAHKRAIGFVPQDGALFPHLTVAENIGFGLARSLPLRAARIAELAGMVVLDLQLLQRYPHEISGGQQQRVALARALAQQPRLMLLDEPFSSLDTGLRASTRKTTAQVLQKAGITTILVTHDQNEALSFADQITILRQGQLVQVGTPQDVYWHPADPETATFMGDAVLVDAVAGGGWAQSQLGPIAVADITRHGPVMLMLRPEQVQISSQSPSAQAIGIVKETEFGGSFSSVHILLATGLTLKLRLPSQNLPAMGTSVGITVSGAAHMF